MIGHHLPTWLYGWPIVGKIICLKIMNFFHKSNVSHLELKKCSTSHNFICFWCVGYGKVQATFTKLVYDKYSRWTFLFHHLKKLFILRKNEYYHDAFSKYHKLLVNMFQYYSM